MAVYMAGQQNPPTRFTPGPLTAPGTHIDPQVCMRMRLWPRRCNRRPWTTAVQWTCTARGGGCACCMLAVRACQKCHKALLCGRQAQTITTAANSNYNNCMGFYAIGQGSQVRIIIILPLKHHSPPLPPPAMLCHCMTCRHAIRYAI